MWKSEIENVREKPWAIAKRRASKDSCGGPRRGPPLAPAACGSLISSQVIFFLRNGFMVYQCLSIYVFRYIWTCRNDGVHISIPSITVIGKVVKTNYRLLVWNLIGYHHFLCSTGHNCWVYLLFIQTQTYNWPMHCISRLHRTKIIIFIG